MNNKQVFTKVDGKPNLLRDNHNNAIINSDELEYYAYIESFKQKKSELSKINSLENEVKQIKDDISEIKNLLISLIK